MFDYRRFLTMLDSMELQMLVCDVAQACALHVACKDYELDGYDEPLFCKTFEHTYDATFKHFNGESDEEIPF